MTAAQAAAAKVFRKALAPPVPEQAEGFIVRGTGEKPRGLTLQQMLDLYNRIQQPQLMGQYTYTYTVSATVLGQYPMGTLPNLVPQYDAVYPHQQLNLSQYTNTLNAYPEANTLNGMPLPLPNAGFQVSAPTQQMPNDKATKQNLLDDFVTFAKMTGITE